MKIITVASLKGGVGKTTLSIYLAEALRQKKKTVLVIDSDPNNSLTDFYLSREPNGDIDERNLYHALSGRANFKDVVHKGAFGQEIIPCTLQLHGAGGELSQDPLRLLTIATKLQKEFRYDFIIIDTPPSLTYEMRTGLYAADLVLTPVAPSRWIVHGLTLLRGEIKKMNEAFPRKVDHWMVPFMIGAADSAVLAKIDITPKTKAHIPKMAELKNKPGRGQLLKTGSKAALLFEQLAKEVI